MVATHSNMLKLGTAAPNFSLPDTISGKIMSLEALKSDKATVVMFICNHCPFVQHVNHQLVELATEFQAKGVTFAAISSNDIQSYPEDSPEKMRDYAARLGYPFPYLYDETQEVARAYNAACTPDFFIFDQDMKLVYRGQLDDSRPGLDISVTGKDIRSALDNLLSGEPVNPEQKPSIGCSIKWKD